MSKNIEIVEKIESLLQELKDSLGASPKKDTKASSKEPKTSKAFTGLTGSIHELVQEGFFKEPKGISDVQKKLRDEGINKPTTSLTSPLRHLLKKKILARSKPADGKGTYQYHQR